MKLQEFITYLMAENIIWELTIEIILIMIVSYIFYKKGI